MSHFQLLRARSVAASLVVCLALGACSGGSANLFQTAVPKAPIGMASGSVLQSGTVVLPTGSSIDPTKLQAVNSVGQAPVSPSGAFTIGAFSTDPQFTMVKGPSGAPLMLGFLGSSQTKIDALSTAEVLVYFAAFVYALPEPARDTAVASLASTPGIANVQQALANAILMHPSADALADRGVTAAIDGLLAAAAGSSAMHLPIAAGLSNARSIASNRHRQDISVNPSNGASGITIVTEIPDGIHFENRYRRLAKAFVDEVSHVPVGSTSPVNDRSPDTSGAPVEIPSVNALNGVIGTIGDILGGNYAYAPTDTPSMPLPNVPGASSTLYRVAIVGPGALAGDALLPAEQDTLTATSVQFVFLDLVLPLVASVALPLKAEQYLDGSSESNVLGALGSALGILQADPTFKALAAAGDIKGVLTYALPLIASATPLQSALFAGLSALVASKFPAGVDAGAALATNVGRIATLGDLTLAAVDKALVAADLARSDRNDVYMVTVIPTRLSITPASSIVDNSSLPLVLTTNVVNASTLSSDDTLTYAYTNTAKFGHTSDNANATNQDTFKSNSPTIFYDSNPTGAGTDTITVTVSDFNSANHTTLMLGTATATVTVGPQRLAVTPAKQTLAQSGKSSLTASLMNASQLPPGTIAYKWTDNAMVGSITDPASGTLNSFTTSAATVPYAATVNGNGIDTITVQAILTTGSQPPEVIASATATVTVVAVTVALSATPASLQNTATSTLAATANSSGAAPDGTITYAWANTAGYGHITDPLNSSARDSFTTAVSSLAYTPNAGATGSDTITVSAILTNGQMTQILGTDSKTITVTAASSNFTTSWNAFSPPAGQISGTFAGPGTLGSTDAALTFATHTYAYGYDFNTQQYLGQTADDLISGSVAPTKIGGVFETPSDAHNSAYVEIDFISPYPTLTNTQEPPYCTSSCTHMTASAQLNDMYLPDDATAMTVFNLIKKWLANNPQCLAAPRGSIGCGRSS